MVLTQEMKSKPGLESTSDNLGKLVPEKIYISKIYITKFAAEKFWFNFVSVFFMYVCVMFIL